MQTRIKETHYADGSVYYMPQVKNFLFWRDISFISHADKKWAILSINAMLKQRQSEKIVKVNYTTK